MPRTTHAPEPVSAQRLASSNGHASQPSVETKPGATEPVTAKRPRVLTPKARRSAADAAALVGKKPPLAAKADRHVLYEHSVQCVESEIDFIDDGPGKPVGIAMHIGQHPILAFGNSDGDLQMLQYTCLPAGHSYCAFIHHTDAEREWAYDRDSDVGRLDKGLEAAATNGWTLVDMATDWKTIFPAEPK